MDTIAFSDMRKVSRDEVMMDLDVTLRSRTLFQYLVWYTVKYDVLEELILEELREITILLAHELRAFVRGGNGTSRIMGRMEMVGIPGKRTVVASTFRRRSWKQTRSSVAWRSTSSYDYECMTTWSCSHLIADVPPSPLLRNNRFAATLSTPRPEQLQIAMQQHHARVQQHTFLPDFLRRRVAAFEGAGAAPSKAAPRRRRKSHPSPARCVHTLVRSASSLVVRIDRRVSIRPGHHAGCTTLSLHARPDGCAVC